MSNMKPLKMCVGASAGGHMNQLLNLLEASGNWPQRPSFYITTLQQLAEKLEKLGPTYVIGECNRLHPLMTIIIFLRSLKIVLKERPDVVITTGSLPLALVCLSAKLFGAKIIWIDSIANVEKLSMSGAMVRYFADLFITQWPELTKEYNNTEFAGTLL